MRRLASCFLIVLLLSVLPAQAAEYPATPAGLESLTKDIMDALQAKNTEAAQTLIKSFLLPQADAYFVKVWGDEKGKQMAEQYAKVSAPMPAQILKMFQDQLAQNRTRYTAYKVDAPDDKNATGLQSKAIEAMKEKVPLYGVRLVAPGHELGMHLWSFVYVDGGFRLIGKVGQ